MQWTTCDDNVACWVVVESNPPNPFGVRWPHEEVERPASGALASREQA
jgi:hypothetical protein